MMKKTLDLVLGAKNYRLKRGITLFAVSLMAMSISSVVMAGGTTYVVNTTADGDDGSCDALRGGGGDCTLREAVGEANNSVGADIITLPAGTYQLSLGEIAISDALTINGTGDPEVSGEGNDRVFNVQSSLTLNDFTIRTGSALTGGCILNDSPLNLNNMLFTDCDATGNVGDQGGGAIFNDGGIVTATNTSFISNFASGTLGSGGAIFNYVGGVIDMTGGAITANVANRAGGGIEEDSNGLRGTSGISLTNVLMNNNSVCQVIVRGFTSQPNPGNGGGLHVTTGNVEISGGSVVGNCAEQEGGGLWNNGAATMTVTGTLIDDNTARGNEAHDGGGGIFDNGGTLVLTNVDITNNRATGNQGSGGGIQSFGQIQMNGGLISNNFANRAGGGVEMDDNPPRGNRGLLGDLDVTGTTFAGNIVANSPGNGGGIHLGSGLNGTLHLAEVSNNGAGNEGGGVWVGVSSILQISETTIDNNSAPVGGGIYLQEGQLDRGGVSFAQLSRSTLSNNNALGFGNERTVLPGNGGGAYAGAGTSLRILNSTVSGNTADGNGGGVYYSTDNFRGGDQNVFALASTIVENTALGNGGGIYAVQAPQGDVGIGSTIVGNNTATSGPDIFGEVESLDYNLIEDTSGATISGTTTNTITGVDPELGPLQDNGGNTATHLPAPTSPVVDQGSLSNFARGGGGDQRNMDRVVDIPEIPNADDGADIGSVEITEEEFRGSASVLEIPTINAWGMSVLGLLLALGSLAILRHRP